VLYSATLQNPSATLHEYQRQTNIRVLERQRMHQLVKDGAFQFQSVVSNRVTQLGIHALRGGVVVKRQVAKQNRQRVTVQTGQHYICKKIKKNFFNK
jgi:hypothetical protein